MQNLINAALREPEAALDHLRSYGQLARIEVLTLLQAWRRRTLLTAGALILAGLSFGFLGLLAMACALLPAGSLELSQVQWALLCAPAALSAAGALACLLAMRRTHLPDPLEQLGRQWQLDAAWLSAPRQDGP